MTPAEREARMARLPVWAQAEIRNLEAALEAQRLQLREREPQESDTVLEPYADLLSGGQQPLPLGVEPLLAFGTTHRWPIHVRWDAEQVGLRVQVPDASILVAPTSSNQVIVRAFRSGRGGDVTTDRTRP